MERQVEWPAVTVPVTVRVRDSKPVEMRIIDFAARRRPAHADCSVQRTCRKVPHFWQFSFRTTLVSSVSVEARSHAEFIRNQPGGTRDDGYIHQGSLEVRRKFTNDLEDGPGS